MGNGSLFYFYRCKKQTVKAASVKLSKRQTVKAVSVKASSVKVSSVKVSSVNCQSVKCQSVKCQSGNCQNGNCQNGKCQKNDFDSLTVADGRTRLKKQGNTWFFQKFPYYSSVNCQSVNDCQNGGLTVNCKQIRHFRATVKLSRRSADKK